MPKHIWKDYSLDEIRAVAERFRLAGEAISQVVQAATEKDLAAIPAYGDAELQRSLSAIESFNKACRDGYFAALEGHDAESLKDRDEQQRKNKR